STWLVNEQKERAEANFRAAQEQRARAEANFRLTQDAVDRFFTKVSESKLLNVPGQQPLREELLEMAREFYQKFVNERADDPDVRADFGNALSRLARISASTGSPAKAVELYQQAREIQERLVLAEPAEARHRHNLALTANGLGIVCADTGRGDEAK